MTELERKALLGDQEAQRLCTEKRIAIPCPCCGCEERDMIGLSVSHDQYYYSCEACGCNGSIVFDNDSCDYPEYDALVAWNSRPAPPIGRCGDCEYFNPKNSLGTQGICMCGEIEMNYGGEFYPLYDDFCRYFEPKERE